jgi:hypothetical protein
MQQGGGTGTLFAHGYTGIHTNTHSYTYTYICR